ncbi:MAG: UDP-N-acetylmuramoyl-L-alanyl-D-glutamate--2,6-diaminopimelate ligase [Proteobacteria bacterium]|nr:UDP-N-acetylmuramoyl-L-alanyl-D-glutamate--2,6-diaminopimelate ligase [Pseudomonadota bacterium]
MSLDLPKVSSLASHHEKVEAGGAYFAIKGSQHDGEDYIDLAIKKGAKVIYIQRPTAGISTVNGIQHIAVPNIRTTLAKAAAAHYLLQPANIVLITGTSGKTSIAEYYRQMTEKLGYKSASLGTMGLISNVDGIRQEETLTTPDPILLHQLLENITKRGVTHLAIEASSHGIQQHRLDGVRFKAAGFTNLSHDHLDYHITMDAYFEAKARLFGEMLSANSTAVLFADNEHYSKLSNICKNREIRVLDYGREAQQIRLEAFEPGKLELRVFGKHYITKVHADAEFQAYNIACALGLMLAVENDDAPTLINTLEHLTSAKGRLEKVYTFQGGDIYIDYAHKPDALAKVLAPLRERCKGRLIVVFGCGGDRDRLKRPIMGEIAARYADIVVVTDDNPRTESAADIRKEILQSCPNAIEIADRATAVAEAAHMLQDKDILLIAGKGHEEYQIIGNEKLPYSDFKEIQRL